MRVAITGGIGSGKSYVCKRLEAFGIRVYDCDAAAKRLMRTSSALQRDLCRLVGDDVYVDGVLQKQVLAKFLLASEDNKQATKSFILPWLVISNALDMSGWRVPSCLIADSTVAYISTTSFAFPLPWKYASSG